MVEDFNSMAEQTRCFDAAHCIFAGHMMDAQTNKWEAAKYFHLLIKSKAALACLLKDTGYIKTVTSPRITAEYDVGYRKLRIDGKNEAGHYLVSTELFVNIVDDLNKLTAAQQRVIELTAFLLRVVQQEDGLKLWQMAQDLLQKGAPPLLTQGEVKGSQCD